MLIEIPMALPSRGNITHAHWAGRHKEVKRVRRVVRDALEIMPTVREFKKAYAELGGPLSIKVTRVAPRRLDAHDNLRTALKAACDAITAWLGHKTDDHADLRWFYDQASDTKGRINYTAIRIEIQLGHYECPTCKAPHFAAPGVRP